MPWKENQVVDLRLEFVMASFEKGINFTQLCAEYGISTKCGYKWKERFLSEGKAGLVDKKRTPKSSPKKIPEDVVLELIKLKNNKKFWGSKKILELYKRKFPDVKPPDKSTLDRIFKKAGLTLPKKKRRVKHFGERITLPEKSTQPNHIWTVDFKGW